MRGGARESFRIHSLETRPIFGDQQQKTYFLKLIIIKKHSLQFSAGSQITGYYIQYLIQRYKSSALCPFGSTSFKMRKCYMVLPFAVVVVISFYRIGVFVQTTKEYQPHAIPLMMETVISNSTHNTKPTIDSDANDYAVVHNISNVPVNETKEAKRKRILPISFGLPEGRFERAKHFRDLNKTRDFASMIPGVKKTYIYKTEDSYYDMYATALFGITMKKAGWDCFRHYEIIASGTMPYFLDLNKLPPNTMHDFPTQIVLEAMKLPGVPSEEVVKQAMKTGTHNASDLIRIDVSKFNRTVYDNLMEQLIEYSLEHLTWRSKAKYVFSNVQQAYPCWRTRSTMTTTKTTGAYQQPPRVLFITTGNCEYLSCTLWGGMYEELGDEFMSSYFGPKFQLFKSLPKVGRLYGRGFSYTNVFDTWNISYPKQNASITGQVVDPFLRYRFNRGFFNTIVLTTARNGFCGLRKYFWNRDDEMNTLYDYQRKYNPLVIVVDGNDGNGCHKFSESFQYHFHFIREYNTARRKDKRLPSRWSGCDV